MKVIDLLNKIANGEDVPKKIKVLSDNEIFTYDNAEDDYISELNFAKLFRECIPDVINLFIYLNDEVEIIEEEKENEFTGLKMFSNGKCFCSIDTSEKIKCKDDVKIEDKKIPEKLGECAYVDGEIAYSWSKSEAKLKTRINEIIEYLKENK